jgi:hypothetical protein
MLIAVTTTAALLLPDVSHNTISVLTRMLQQNDLLFVVASSDGQPEDAHRQADSSCHTD